MSGRSKRGPGRPRVTDGLSLNPYPSSPLTPDSEESFLLSMREEGRSTRVRNRPKPQPAKKTRVNAHSKLKSPIRSSPIGSCTERNRDNHDINTEHGNVMEMSLYSIQQALDGSGQPLYDNLTSDGLRVPGRTIADTEEELAKTKVCSFCNCGAEMGMFHGKLQRYAPTPGFNASKKLQNRQQRQNSGCDPFRDRLDIDPLDTGQFVEDPPEPQPIVTRRGPGRPPGRGRRKGIVVVGLPLRSGNQELTVDKTTFGTVREKDLCDVFEEDGFTWAHHCCAAWSEGVSQTDSYDLVNVDKAVVKALSERCNHCNRYGASVVCQIPRCGKTYHYPCAASSGSFQDIKSMTMLCPDHLEDAGRLAGSEAQCVLCGQTKDFAELIFCTSCGRHYHGRCLEPSVDLTSVIRMGWQCPDCKVCQGCRQPGDDNRMLVCDLCDTGYHTYCLDPPMSTIPKTGWKCLSCRRCEDCGSNTPGGGPTSRWHKNFSVCDSCYQQRNKGLFCPLCGRAYRQFTDVAMVQCLSCEKWIHASCDHIDREDYQKYSSKDLPYICPRCKPKKGSLKLLDKNHGIELAFNEQPTDVDMSLDFPAEDKRTLTIAAGRTSPINTDEDLLLPSHLDDMNPLRHFDPVLDVTDTETIPIPNLDNIEPEKLSLEKLPLDEEMEVVVKPEHELEMLANPADLSDSCSLPSFSVMDRHLSEPKPPAPSYYQHRNFYITPPKVSVKRKLTGKIKSKTSGTPARKKSKHGKPGRPPNKLKSKAAPQTSPGKENVPSTAITVDQTNQEEESESLHTTLVLFSATDEFTHRQDMCLCCGSFGKGPEGQLIMCSQCGQSYHPYCVGVKINKVILTKGWRCLDCTLCEGCGKGSDEARLLLCDSCDISYHTYCLDPPLGHVPQGGWKCKWCVVCCDCGATTPGVGCQWMSNYTQCGPCASKTTCPVCKIKYNTNDLMIQCAHCERWLHGSCDGLVNEEELDRAADYGYHCLYCRPKTKQTLVGVSGPPSPRATALHHYRPQSSQDSTFQPCGKPLHPCQRRNNNLRELKLSSHFNKVQMSEPFLGNNIELTESGVRHMNRLKLPPGNARRRVGKNKVKPKKFGFPVSPVKKSSFIGHLEDKDVIFNRALLDNGDTTMVDDTVSLEHKASLFPSKVSRPRQSSAGRPGVGGFVLRGRGSGGRRFDGKGGRGGSRGKGSGFLVASRSQSHFNVLGNQLSEPTLPTGLNNSKQTSLEATFNQGSNDSWADSSDENGLNDAYPKWMQEAFFGKDLLDTLGRDKRLKHGNKTPSTPSEDEDRANQDPFAPRQATAHQEQHSSFSGTGQVPYQMVSVDDQHTQHSSQALQQPVYPRGGPNAAQKHHSNLGLSGQDIWPQQSAGADPFPSHTLNLADDVPNPDVLYNSLDMLTDELQTGAQNDCHSANRGLPQPTSQHLPPAVTTQAHVPPAVSTWNQEQPRTQGNDLDILDTSDILPHVDGQEVEEIFAGIEREMSNRVVLNFLDSEIDSSVANTQEQFPSPASNPTPNHGVTYQSNQHPMGAYSQAAANHTFNSGSQHFQGVPGASGYQQGAQNHMDGFPNSVVSGQLGFGQNNSFSRPGEIDLDDFPRERRRPPSPRVDPMKQQQKWEEDEKLGAMATISPVLYANLEHVNLKQEYPDWSNRYRAIARLWRKLSVEQREPYRLKARDNRVRLKDQGKKLIARNEDKSKTEPPKQPQINQQQQPPPQQPLPAQPQQQVSQPIQEPLHHQRDQLGPPVSIQPVVENCNVPVTGVIPVPLTPTTPARSVTPVTPGTPVPLTPTTPTPPTFSHGQVLGHPQMGPGIIGTVPNHPSTGKSVTSKGKKTKEEKEREKELRKQRLRVQQEQERQWKILQQKRALEQQRQQQQQQQENVLLRQELKKQQQAKGTKGGEEQKKKRLPKNSKRLSSQSSKDLGQAVDQATVSSPGLVGENSERSIHTADNREQHPVLPLGASFSAAPRANANALASSSARFQSESSLDFLPQCGGQNTELEREGELSTVNSSQEIQTSNSVRGETSHQYQGHSVWQKEPVGETTHHTSEATWEQPQSHAQVDFQKQHNNHSSQSHDPARQNLWSHDDLQPEVIQDRLPITNMQEGTPMLEQHMRANQAEQTPPSTTSSREQILFHSDRPQSWAPTSNLHPSEIPTTQSVMQGPHPSRESVQVLPQPPISDSMQHVPFSSPQEVMMNSTAQQQQHSVELQQPQTIPVMHWQEELSQVRAQVAAAHDLHPPQEIAPTSDPPSAPAPPPPLLSSQQQQQSATLQAYDVSTGWPQQGQVASSNLQPQQQIVPFTQQLQKPGVTQMPFQAIQQPPNQVPLNQHPSLPMSSQSQENQIMQPQQQPDVAQRQQRDQLIRAQQQQFFQMLQHQQVLHQQQQQQQNAAIQPGFARPRFNPVNTKDLPEIDTEEEHQERLRFLYRQRQAQKQQLQVQLMQQAWIQQQLANGGGQAVIAPGVLPVDASNPQMMQQLATQQMRPQMPDMTQQQLFAEYQRRMQQRQDLGQQTIQYDKVLQEFQHQQGIPGVAVAHTATPFVEVPQQRFALRQPTPMVQAGLKPVMPYGVDGQFVGQQQQLLKMQLQQQIMQQQKNELPLKSIPQATLAEGKVDAGKGSSDVIANSESEILQKCVSPARSDAVRDIQEKSSSSVEELTKPCKEPDSDSGMQQPNVKGDGTKGLRAEALCSSFENEKYEKELNYKENHLASEDNARQGSKGTVHGKGSTNGQVNQALSSLDTGTQQGCGESQAESSNANNNRGCDSAKHTVENMAVVAGNGKPREESIESPRNTSSEVSRSAECKVGTDMEGCCVDETEVSTEAQAMKLNTGDITKITEEESKVKTDLAIQHLKIPAKPEECNDINQVAPQSNLAPNQGQEAPPSQLQHFHQDANAPSKPETYHEVNQGPPVPQPQHFLVQQQLVGLQQQLLQMEQQRQVLVQQYQQLQQQLHQAGGQDPVLASQVMAVQSQGQVLQQQMVQVHQQMQLVQQQFALQQQQPQTQQWTQGIQGHQIRVQPSGFPMRPGVMGIQHPLQAAVTVPDKALEEKPKQRRSRSKSKDTPPLGQAKPRRKSKKSETNVDPDLEIQQQMLQQQLYQQIEQRHRLMQQKQGVFVEQAQPPCQQPPMPLSQHLADNPGMLPQQPVDVPHVMRPLSHPPELSQKPPSRPDSQVSLPETPGHQMSIPPNTQIPPGYPQNGEQGSFSQRFPTPEHYLQQFGQHPIQHQRQPTVQYVAEANNPFSEQFQGLQSKGRGRGGARKKPGSRKPGKSHAKKATEAAPLADPLHQQQVNPVLQEPDSPWPAPTPSPIAQVIKQEQPDVEGAVPVIPESPLVQDTGHAHPRDSLPQENQRGCKEDVDVLGQEGRSLKATLSQPCSEVHTFISADDNGSCTDSAPKEPSHDMSLAEKESTSEATAPVEHEANGSAGKSKGPCNGTGLEALQKLESMVADMASEEEACKELEKQSELERLQLPLDEDDFDPEMDKIYEGDFLEQTFNRSLLSPTKAVGSGSQANSEASLECHEQSLISPLLEETEKRKDRQKFFAEASVRDSPSVEKKTAAGCGGESVSEQQDREQTPGTPSIATESTPTPALCFVANTALAANVVSGGHVEADQNKRAREETLGESTQNPTPEISSHGEADKLTPQALASTQNCPKEAGHGFENRKYEPSFESTTIGLTHTIDQAPESISHAPITPVGPVVSGSGRLPLVQEGRNRQQAPEAHYLGSRSQGNIVQPSPQQTVPDLASIMVSEAVHETVGQTLIPLSYHKPGHVQETAAGIPARPTQREKVVKTPKPPSRPKNQNALSEAAAKKKPSPKEDDPLKKQLQELRRQEYERKKREYEEQQKKKRALQQQLRMEKQQIREQRKRQRIYLSTSNRSKQKVEIRNNDSSSKTSTSNIVHKEVKPSAPLSLCEPKLLLTHALSHPYGSRPFNGQCLLKGNFGSANVDGIVDYYSQFESSDVDIVEGHPPTPPSSLPPSPRVHQQKNDSSGKPLVNGDVSPVQREPVEALVVSKAHGQDSENPAKRPRYMAGVESARGNVSVPPSMPTPPLSDSAANVSDRFGGKQVADAHADANGKESNGNSLSSSPETVQYIASSSPESDALNRVHTPHFSALLHRDSTDSPTFPAVTVKREKLELYLENGVSQSCTDSCSVSDTPFIQTNCKLEGSHGVRVENDADDLDNIHVTLTLSPTSEQRVTDTVKSVADLIGCSPPRRADIVIEPTGIPVASTGYLASPSVTSLTGTKLSNSIAPMAHTSTDIYQKSPFSGSQLTLSSSQDNSSRKKPEGPYCRHCDVLIIGIGVKRKPDDEGAAEKPTTFYSNGTDTDSADYKIYRVNVEAGDCTGDLFCSDACLKQYFAHLGSECPSVTQENKSELNVLQPRLDASVASEGQTSVGVGNVTSVNESGTRGGVVADGLSPTSFRKIRSPSWKEEDALDGTKNCKRQRRLRWKRWQQSEGAISDNKQRLELTPEEISQLLEKHGALKPCHDLPPDNRLCTLCGDTGDGENNASARLLNLDVDVWVHLNCALWSLEVYETLNGALMNVDVAVKRGTVTNCVVCLKRGATVSCNQKIGLTKIGCPNNFHFTCAIARGCVFFKDKTMLCHEHRPDSTALSDLVLSSYAVYRKVYVNRDDIQQIASMLRHNQETNDKPQTLRVGSLVVKSLGQLLPHQLQSFHTRDAVYPVGFKTVRFYWSMHSVYRRCKYHCTVEDAEGVPSFTIRVEDVEHKEQLVFRGKTPRDAWQQILVPILRMRKETGLINLFPQYITGEDLFGLSEQFVLRIIESMPGVDQMQGYNMRYGPSAIMELPLAVNPTGSARSEPLLRTHFRSARARALRSATSSGPALSPAATVGAGNTDESSSLYLKQFVYSKAAQYRKLKTEWKSNVFLGRSNIQGLGLFANRDMEGGSMVIEYIGSIIRNEVANRREQIYEKQNRGVYMFRIDSDAVIDATMAGGPARYINHSCSPNCVAEVVTFEKEQKIIIISNRKVEKGEELTYDYKFDFEDEENKIACLCGAPNCRKWMN